DVEPIGFIPPPDTFTCDSTDEPNPNQIKQYHPCKGYECLQGHGKVTGRLFGGVGGDTVTVGWSTFSQSPLLAPFEENDDILLFIDDIVDYLSPQVYIDLFRWLHEKGITQNLKGVLFGRLNEYPENPAYKTALLQVMNELDLSHLPILYNLPFGHTNPICALPFGALAEINCDNVTFAILESGVV
ncbi:MAG: hypothetical protein FWF49_03360, partial [Oscillospiraceae bacterium]|nr:hypothetical protein [Oscillospiraceae bacterium]